jgi:arsenate reductase-like glutaredoxin family protein
MSCKKAQGFLERHDLQVADTTDATKVRKGRDEALALAKTASKILVAKGKNVVAIDMKDSPDDDTLAGLLLGPSGNLRAPTLRKGKTLYVGFSEEAYRQLGG